MKALLRNWGLSAIPILMLTLSAFTKLTAPPEVVKQFTGTFGYPADTLVPLGIVELLCMVVYAIPRTAFLGAILVTGYLGGATATHVRVHDNFIAPVVIGVLAWAGLYLRDSRLRALVPIVK